MKWNKKKQILEKTQLKEKNKIYTKNKTKNIYLQRKYIKSKKIIEQIKEKHIFI